MMQEVGDAQQRTDGQEQLLEPSMAKEHPKKASHKRAKECGICKRKLDPSYSKTCCQPCLDKLVAEESPSLLQSIQNLVKNEVRSSVEELKKSLPSSSRHRRPQVVAEDTVDSGSEEGAIADSDSSSEDLTGKPLFRVEDTDLLLKAVRSTMELEEEKESRSRPELMFESLKPKKSRVFPIQDCIKDLIKREWEKPDKKFFIPRAVKRKYPFDDQEVSAWQEVPRVDAPVAKINKKSALPFEDLGSLKDPMDKRADAYLRKNWEASTSAFKPNIATTSVARSLKLWLEELESHIENKTPRDQLLQAIPTMSSAVDFISDASADALRLSARAAALSNSARRSLWLKGWKGDVASKSKLCALPCQGGFSIRISLR
ncbi:uncharacterized protein LOC122939522 [Bufo gargarizans]|uniref:uncharacterized protein LOC122939522 n=1 Tax=Bufo gargarizans TaxID=30331 RepID=UPI001CF3A2C9|nr:uncharacterized protein LOC122939522 [Bufo gargarizans]